MRITRTQKAAGAALGAAASLTVLFALAGPAAAARDGSGGSRPAASEAVVALSRVKADAAIQAHVARGLTSGWVSVVVSVTSPGLTAEQEKRLAGLQADIYRRLPLIGAAACRVPNRNLPALLALPFVERVSQDAEVTKCDELTVESTGADYAYQRYHLTGDGVGVAVLDTGIDRHPDFNGPRPSERRVVAEANFVSSKRKADDECGHGTHIAGIIAGNGSASSGPHFFRTFYGIAREADLVDVRVLDDRGKGSVSTVIAGISWAVARRQQYNIRVLNISFGHEVGESYKSDPLCRAVEAAWKSGIVVVCAAGNSGRQYAATSRNRDNGGYGTRYGSIQSPANSPYVITVGAMKPGPSGGRQQHQIASYSSRGPSRLDFVLKPDIVAPGDGVISTLANNSYLDRQFGNANVVNISEYRDVRVDRPSNRYMRLSGTSMAAPVVAGAVALLLEKEPWLTPDTVKARLMVTADKWNGAGGVADACTFGAGYLNIPAALSARFVATAPALSPTLMRTQQGDVYIDTHNLGAGGRWGTNGVEGLQAIWGGNAVGQNGRLFTPALGTLSVWGDRSVSDYTITSVDLTSVVIQGDR
jgi:Subtilisin-like serine proteases